MKKLLAFCLPVLLLFSCGKTGERQLTLIFENAPENSRAIYESDSVSFIEKENTVKRLYYFSTDRWIEQYIPQGANDTVTVGCGANSHLEFYHNYRFYAYHYVLLQAGDTVYVRYESDGTPVYRSSTSNNLTTLYNGDILVFGKPPNRFRDGLYYKLERSLSEEARIKNEVDLSIQKNISDSLLQIHESNLEHAKVVVESLVNAETMSFAYQQYYNYRIKKQSLEPELIHSTAQTYLNRPSLNQDVFRFFNDDFSRNISYWHTVGSFTIPLVEEGGNWQPPIIELANGSKMVDETAVFDRLEQHAAEVPPATLNMMRYESLIKIGMPEYGYPKEVQDKYFERYRRHTTDFLIPNYVPIKETVSFPFQFFIFLLEFIICSGMFFGVYVYLLKDKAGFLINRIYLLASLVLSAVIPLLALPSHLAIIPYSALFRNGIFNTFLQVAFHVNLLGCVYMLGSYAWQLYSIRRLWNDSWRIHDGNYRLCILMNSKVCPFTFFRNIFFSWDDWWNINDKESRNQILEHEIAHVKLWHGLDNVLLILGRILYWANPLLYIYGKEIRKVNEFAADHAVAKVYDKTGYMQVLRKGNSEQLQIRSILVNNSNDELEERFEKMRAKPVSKGNNFRLLLIIPLAIFLMLLFSSELLVNLGKLPEVYNLLW